MTIASRDPHDAPPIAMTFFVAAVGSNTIIHRRRLFILRLLFFRAGYYQDECQWEDNQRVEPFKNHDLPRG
ncbi:MAG: hypothetical protein GF310_14620 [candidate division Zixibacteria bacterium]|nr:hypothetical protein [candidate division Zixibacteria bacterium]